MEIAERDPLWTDFTSVSHHLSGRRDWLGAGFESPSGGGPPVVVVLVTDDVAYYRTFLRRRVPHPERMIVRAWPYSQADLLRIERELLRSLFRGRGPGVNLGLLSAERPGRLDLVLRADAEATARDVHRRYGGAVCIRVGSFPYPWDRDQAAEVDCGTLPTSTPRPDLEFRLDLERSRAASGEFVRGTVTIVNRGSTPVRLEAGQPGSGHVLRPGGRRVAGAAHGATADSLRNTVLQPGQSFAIDGGVGTGSCVPEEGYLLRPGRYEVRAVVNLYRERAPEEGQPDPTHHLTEAAPLVLE